MGRQLLHGRVQYQRCLHGGKPFHLPSGIAAASAYWTNDTQNDEHQNCSTLTRTDTTAEVQANDISIAPGVAMGLPADALLPRILQSRADTPKYPPCSLMPLRCPRRLSRSKHERNLDVHSSVRQLALRHRGQHETRRCVASTMRGHDLMTQSSKAFPAIWCPVG